MIGRRIEVVADLHQVQALRDGRMVADHDRVGAKNRAITSDEHVTAARALRAARHGLLRPAPTAEQVEIQPLSHYDTALGPTEDWPRRRTAVAAGYGPPLGGPE